MAARGVKHGATHANRIVNPVSAGRLHALHHPERTTVNQVVRGESESGHQFLGLGIGIHTIKRVTLRFSIHGVDRVKECGFARMVVDYVLLAATDCREFL